MTFSSKLSAQRIRRYSFPPRRRMPHFREGAQRRNEIKIPPPYYRIKYITFRPQRQGDWNMGIERQL